MKLRVVVFECPVCKRKTSMVLDEKTDATAFCKPCGKPMRELRGGHEERNDDGHSK